MNGEHEVHNVSVEDGILRMNVDGVLHEVDLRKSSRRLSKATDLQCANLKISSDGYGIHWPDVDEDLTVGGMIRNAQAGYPEIY